jgi:adenosine deaminase
MSEVKTTTTIPDRFFADIPKVDIHCHLYGTIREATLQEFVRESGAPMSEADVSGFYVRGEKPKGVLHAFRFMEEFILGNPDRLYRLTSECLEDLRSENVRYAELFWNSTGTLQHAPQLTFAEAQAAILDAMDDAERKFGIGANLIHAIDRQASPEDAVTMMDRALAAPHPKVVGLGIDYLETGHPPEGFWKAYQMAREAGWKTTAHAGEFGCHWRNIETALDLLHVDRLDHGYTILDNPELLQTCVERDIVLTVVPTNSYYMRTLDRSEWADKHPIRQLARQGLKIHPNTDDPTFHNITPNLVWKMMHEAFGYTAEDLRSFMLNGLQAAWIDGDTRQIMTHQFIGDFDAAAAQNGLQVV